MPAVARTPREGWIAQGLRALADGGPDAVRVESLAARLGVTKGGFYGHFRDRRGFLEEVLDAWERRSIDDVLARVEAGSGDVRVKLRRAGALTFAEELLPIDLAVRDWARRDSAVAARLRRVDNHRMSYLRTLFAGVVTDPQEIEARSTLAFTLAIGVHFMAADHGPHSRRDVLTAVIEQLLATPADVTAGPDGGSRTRSR